MNNEIYPCLWFDGKAKEAAEFYCSIFKNAKITTDTPLIVNFNLEGKKFMGLNGGPMFKFNEAISFQVSCETQQEVDYYWEKLSEGGDEKAQQCGWLKDKYGVSWQIIPEILIKMLNDSDSQKSQRVMEAMLGMKKIEIDGLRRAYSE